MAETDDITANYHGGNPRSIEAHESVRATKGRQRELVLRFIRYRGVDGSTCDEAVVWDMLTRRQQTDLWRLVLAWVADKRQIGFPEYFEGQRQSKSLLGVVARRLWSR